MCDICIFCYSNANSLFCYYMLLSYPWDKTDSRLINVTDVNKMIINLHSSSSDIINTVAETYNSSTVITECSVQNNVNSVLNKKAQLSLTNPRDAKACQNCSNSTCLQRCRWEYWPIFMRLTAVASEIREIPRNSLKIQTYGVQGHPRSSILVPIESPYMTCY